MQARLELDLDVRDVDPEDLPDLDWSGGPDHVTALATALARREAGETDLLAVHLPNGHSIAVGAVDYSKHQGAGELWMLSVRGGSWQSLGVGTILINALEGRIRDRGLLRATIGVEHDNPRAAALYRRLGYRENGMTLDGWGIGDGRSYATVCYTMIKSLD